MEQTPPGPSDDSPAEGEWLPPEPPGPRPDLGGGAAQPTDPAPRPAAPATQPPPSQAWPPPPAWGQPPAWSQPPAWGQPPAWPPPPVWQPADTGPGNGPAVAGLSLALSASALLMISAGLFFVLSLPCAILAIVFGRKGRLKVDAGETEKHRGLAQAGFVIGIVTLVLSLLAAAGWIALLAADPDFIDDLNKDGDGDELDFTSLARVALAVARAALPIAG